MIRPGWWWLSLTLTAFPACVFAQAGVEYAVGAGAASGAAAGTAAPLKGTFNGAIRTLDKALKSNSGAVDQTAPPALPIKKVRVRTPSPRTAGEVTAAKHEDPFQIETGMEYGEMIRRFGPPSIQFTGEAAAKTAVYLQKGSPIQIEIRDGKVASINKPKS